MPQGFQNLKQKSFSISKLIQKLTNTVTDIHYNKALCYLIFFKFLFEYTITMGKKKGGGGGVVISFEYFYFLLERTY